MQSDLFIIGTMGQAKESAQLARCLDPEAKKWHHIHYVTNDKSLLGQMRPFGQIDTMDDELIGHQSPIDVVIGVGQPLLRQRIVESLRVNSRIRFPNLIHPRVEIDLDLVRIGIGNMITQGVVLTCDTSIGNFNLLNWNVTVGHDSEIGSYNVINPGSSISGGVKLGDGCLIGTGARILEGLQIGDRTIIGAGAVLTRSIEVSGGVFVGIPACEKHR